MYIPHHFKNENLAEVKSFIKSNSFGILLTNTGGKMQGSHIPLEIEIDPSGNEIIYGHISKANLQWKEFEKGKEVLLIFNGPQAYVSSSWYDHENVSTWNYIAVHIYGEIEILGKEELKFALDKLVNKYESKMKDPFLMKDMPEETLNQMKGVVGFKVRINEIQAAYKLSQNRNRDDYNKVINELKESNVIGNSELAKKMEEKS